MGRLSSFLQGDSERCSFAHNGGFHEYLAFVVVLDDAAGEA